MYFVSAPSFGWSPHILCLLSSRWLRLAPRQTSSNRGSPRLVMRSVRWPLPTVSVWSRFKTQVRGIPSSGPSSTSVGSPRIVVVARARNISLRLSIAPWRVRTRAGRRPTRGVRPTRPRRGSPRLVSGCPLLLGKPAHRLAERHLARRDPRRALRSQASLHKLKTDLCDTRRYSGCYMAQESGKSRGPRTPRPVPPSVRRALAGVAGDVAAWRKLRGLTQAQLADRAGVSRDTLVRLEGGEGGVSVENLLRVLRALGVLDGLVKALDPYETDVGRLRSEERLPQRVRPRSLTGRGDG